MNGERKTENHSNPDIDPSRSHLNLELVSSREKPFKTDIEQYIDENKVTSKAVRKDAVVCNEWIISSDREFFRSMDLEEQQRYFSSAKEYFEERFGSENVRYAIVHFDETTPHMHMGVVPFDEERKLSSKRVFSKQVLIEIQEDFPKFLQERGFEIERGIRDPERLHLETPEFKKAMEKTREMSEKTRMLKQELKILQADRSLKLDQLKAMNKGLSKTNFRVPAVEDLPKVPMTNKVMVDRKVMEGIVERDNKREALFEMGSHALDLLSEGDSSYREMKNLTKDTQEMKDQAEKTLSEASELKLRYESLFQSQKALNQSFVAQIEKNRELERKYKVALEDLKRYQEHSKGLLEKVDSMEELQKGAYESLTNVVKAASMLKYDKDTGYRVEGLTDKQGKLIDALAEYGAKWAKNDGFPELAETMEKHIGISKSIEDIMSPPLPFKGLSFDMDLEL